MKKSIFFEWQLLILALGSLIIVCQGTPGIKLRSSPLKSSYVDLTPTEANITSGEEDEFMPYQGNRFNVFDWNMCKLMANKYQGNFLISPLSVKLALIIFYEGAKEQAAHEIANVVDLPAEKFKTRNKFAVILNSLKSQPVANEYKLDIGTHVYLRPGITVKKPYRSTLKNNYETLISRINFTNSNAVTVINNWVSNITHKNIEKIIEDGDNVKDSVMLVVNALYFKGSWYKNRFPLENTRTAKFYKTPESTINVPFMVTSGNFRYAESVELDAKILRIPYAGNKFSMHFILPNVRDGLDILLENINSFSITRHMLDLQEIPLEIRIPKFKFAFTSHLEPILRELGIRDIFDNSAFFDEIAFAGKNAVLPVVTDVLQKAGIEVNEKGTTGYVTTDIEVGNKMGEQQFFADHPFLFFIEDEVSGTILYMGRISDPSATTGSTKTAAVPSLNRRFNENVPQPPSFAKVTTANSNTERHNYFNSELFQALNKDAVGNIIVSPLSVKTALTALVEGSGGRTRQELLATLRLPTDITQIRNAARNTFIPFQDPKSGTEVNVATRVWTAKGNQISYEYGNSLQNYYNGDVRSIDFTDATNSANAINEWVRLATKNNIRNFIEPGSVARDTILLLTSAVYFKGRWLKAFDESATTMRCFRVPDVGCQKVPMMENVSKYNYAYIPSLDTDVAEIPYSDGRLSMLVFLPRQEGVEKLEVLARDLSYTSVSTILASLRETELLVAIPRFSIYSKYDLRPVLEGLGIKDLFNLNANLTGILPEVIARVGNVLHDAKIEVNEVGTIAAAATGVSIIPLMGNSFESFRVDRPFSFTIVDRTTSTILFAGRVVKP